MVRRVENLSDNSPPVSRIFLRETVWGNARSAYVSALGQFADARLLNWSRLIDRMKVRETNTCCMLLQHISDQGGATVHIRVSLVSVEGGWSTHPFGCDRGCVLFQKSLLLYHPANRRIKKKVGRFFKSFLDVRF